MSQRAVGDWARTGRRTIYLAVLTAAALAGLVLLGSSATAAGQSSKTAAGQNLSRQANPPKPCCEITSINAATGVVTARNSANGQTFEFKLTNPQALQALKVGQGIYANFGARQVSLDAKTPSGSITSMGPVNGAGSAGAAGGSRPIGPAGVAGGTTALQNLGNLANPGAPCCIVTAVSSPSLITAGTSAGAYFVFSLNAELPFPPVVTVNQKVYANFKTMQVSLDGTSALGTIKYLCAVPQNQPCPAGAASCLTEPFTGGQGCPNQTVQTSTPALCRSGYYGPLCLKCPPCPSPSVCSDGIAGSGTCDSGSAPPPQAPVATPAAPSASAPQPASPSVPGASGQPAKGARTPPTTPACCSITNINPATGVVTAKVNSTGQIFEFTPANTALISQMHPGQGVYANLRNKQVSLDGTAPSGTIVAMGPATPAHPPVATPSVPPQPATVPKPSTPLQPAAPASRTPAIDTACCTITSINSETGVVNAKVNNAGQTFQFKATPQLLRSLSVGQSIFANFAKQQVSIDGTNACCGITSISSVTANILRGTINPFRIVPWVDNPCVACTPLGVVWEYLPPANTQVHYVPPDVLPPLLSVPFLTIMFTFQNISQGPLTVPVQVVITPSSGRPAQTIQQVVSMGSDVTGSGCATDPPPMCGWEEATFTWQPAAAGNYTITAAIDPDGTLGEDASVRAQNTTSISATVPPPLPVTAILDPKAAGPFSSLFSAAVDNSAAGGFPCTGGISNFNLDNTQPALEITLTPPSSIPSGWGGCTMKATLYKAFVLQNGWAIAQPVLCWTQVSLVCPAGMLSALSQGDTSVQMQFQASASESGPAPTNAFVMVYIYGEPGTNPFTPSTPPPGSSILPRIPQLKVSGVQHKTR